MRPEEVAARVKKAAGARPSLVNVSVEEGCRAEARGGKLAAFERWKDGWVSLELSDGAGRVGFASATLGAGKFDAGALVAAALASATVADADPARELNAKPARAPGPDAGLCDEGWDFGDRDAPLSFAARLEAAALSADERLTSARKPAFEAEGATRLVMLCGQIAATWRETSFSLQLEVAAQSGESRESGWASGEARMLGDLNPEAVGREAGYRAASLLGARRAYTGAFPALIDARVATELLDVLAPSFLADSQRKKTALFAFERGLPIFSPKLTLIDDGALLGGLASQPVDDEGEPSRRNALVEGGALTALLFDRAEAARSGGAPTGNGAGGPEGPAGCDATNFFIVPGTADRQTLQRRLERGLYVTEVMGMHTADPITGDFSVGCAGFWIEGGEIAWPVTRSAISGNILKLFAGLEDVGSDFRFFGSFGSPTLRLASIDVAG